jgi:hypothetical protein
MLTILVILAIWVVLSVPMSVVLGCSFRADSPLELLGMDGDVAVFRSADGTLERMPLSERATY